MGRKSFFMIVVIVLLLVAQAVVYIVPAAAQEVESLAETGVTLSIPAIDVEAPIVTLHIRAFPSGEVTWDTSSITTEVGFLDGMAWFGQGGNIVLGGHSELAGRAPAVFYHLDEVVVGDEIIVNDNGTEWRYVVTETFTVSDRDLSILYPTRSERLTLMTCDTDSLVGGQYSRRVVVIAERA
ncbi:sortase [bacterium]|nr:sortase [bacterium]